MITLLFGYANEKVFVIIDGKDVKFGNTVYGAFVASIDNLKLDRAGVIKEFPDLKEDLDWRIKAIKRFKNKIKSFRTEDEIAKYIIQDLKKYGYKPEFKQMAGYRPIRIS